MKIKHLLISIRPWRYHDSIRELLVELSVDGNVCTSSIAFKDDDLESRFDLLFDEARREVLKVLKSKRIPVIKGGKPSEA